MRWRIEISDSAAKFFARNELTEYAVRDIIVKTIRYFHGEDVNVNIKKLKGEWKDFYRIRSGRMRIIAEFRFGDSVVFIEQVDWRGSVYK